MSDLSDLTLIPADDPQSSAGDDLAAAVSGAQAAQQPVQPAPPKPVQPFGNSWSFDWDAGQFRRVGQSPSVTYDFDTLNEWALMAVHTARYSSPLLSDNFGMEKPDGIIGELAEGEALADWTRNLVDALMVHDRVTSVENVNLDWDPTTGILTIISLQLITDTDATVTVSDVTLQEGDA